MRLDVNNHTKRLVGIAVLSLAIVGLSTGIAFKLHPFASAASTHATTTNDGETKDDATKAATPVNVQDNGQDGEIKDSALQ